MLRVAQPTAARADEVDEFLTADCWVEKDPPVFFRSPGSKIPPTGQEERLPCPLLPVPPVPTGSDAATQVSASAAAVLQEAALEAAAAL